MPYNNFEIFVFISWLCIKIFKEACLHSLHNPDYENWNTQVVLILLPFYSQWFPNHFKISYDNLLFALEKCFVVDKSLNHLSSIEVGVLKFNVVELVWCENFIKSESNANFFKERFSSAVIVDVSIDILLTKLSP